MPTWPIIGDQVLTPYSTRPLSVQKIETRHGNAIAVWQDFDAQNNSVIMSSYFNGNTYLWGAPERVSDLGQSSEDAPKVKMGTGGFVPYDPEKEDA